MDFHSRALLVFLPFDDDRLRELQTCTACLADLASMGVSPLCQLCAEARRQDEHAQREEAHRGSTDAPAGGGDATNNDNAANTDDADAAAWPATAETLANDGAALLVRHARCQGRFDPARGLFDPSWSRAALDALLARAAAALRAAAARDPRHVACRTNLGIALFRQGDMAAAERAHRAALALAPDDARALNNLGNVLHATGRAAEAERAWRRAGGRCARGPRGPRRPCCPIGRTIGRTTGASSTGRQPGAAAVTAMPAATAMPATTARARAARAARAASARVRARAGRKSPGRLRPGGASDCGPCIKRGLQPQGRPGRGMATATAGRVPGMTKVRAAAMAPAKRRQ